MDLVLKMLLIILPHTYLLMVNKETIEVVEDMIIHTGLLIML
jgi:hypothetical protein